MKKIYILVLISFAVLFNGCKEDFLETTSTQTVDEQAVFNDTQSAMLAVNGLHKLMWTGDLSSSAFYGGYDMLMIWYEVMGDDWYIRTAMRSSKSRLNGRAIGMRRSVARPIFIACCNILSLTVV